MAIIRFKDLHIRAFDPVHKDLASAAPHREYWLYGGRGSTKSSFISLEIVLGLLKDPSYNAICFRRFANTLRDSVYAQILWAIGKMGLARYFEARKVPLEIVYLPTGQRILFRGADDPLKLKSIKLKKGFFRFLWFEELSEFRCMEDIRSIQQSVLRGHGDSFVFMSYNPPRQRQSWVNAEQLRPVPYRMAVKTTYLDVSAAWLGADFLARAEELKAHNPDAYRNEYLGECTGLGGQVFSNLDLKSLSKEEVSRFDRLYAGLDFGFATDPDAFVLWHYDKKADALYAVSEYVATGTETETLCRRVKELAGANLVACDCAEPRMIMELKRRGIRAFAAKKGAGSVEHGMRRLQEVRRIAIDPERTPIIAREFSLYEYEKDRLGAFLPAFPDRDNHTIDATRYALERVFGVKAATTFAR